MSEKIADDYGLTQLLAYLKAHAYTGGTNGTFALATDSDMGAVLTTGERTDWSDGRAVKKSIGYCNTPAWPSKGICNYVHVPGNSIIFEYMMNTQDSNIGQNGPVSQPSGACYVPYYLNAINKQIFDDEGYADPVPGCVARIKALYDANQARLDAHFAKYKETKDWNTAFTMEDVIYAYKVSSFLGTSTSTESSWEEAYVRGEHKFELAGSNFSGASYNEAKAKERAERLKASKCDYTAMRALYPKLKNLEHFRLLFGGDFGDFDAYIAYLSGGAS